MTWLIVILATAILVGRLRRRWRQNLAGAHARAWWLLLIGLILQVVANYVPAGRQSLAVGLLLASYVAILLMVWLNRNAPGMWIAGIGLLMNFVVISLNGGMQYTQPPWRSPAGASAPPIGGKHVLLTPDTVVALPRRRHPGAGQRDLPGRRVPRHRAGRLPGGPDPALSTPVQPPHVQRVRVGRRALTVADPDR